MEKGLTKERVKSVDALRAVAILGVILIHTTTRTLEASNYDLVNYSWTLFLNQSARFAAPLFFMISGFVLELGFDNHKNIFSYLKNRFVRIFLPYLFWSTIYYFFVYTVNPNNFVKTLLTGSASYQLYFIPTLCIFYLLFPLLHKIKKVLTNKWFLLVLFISQAVILNYDYFIKPLTYALPIKTAIFSYFSFILGIVASSYKDKIVGFVNKTKYILIPAISYLAYYIFDEGRKRYFETNSYLTFYSQWRVNILVYTILIAILLLYRFEKANFKNQIIDKISKLSFFIFFVHIIVLEIVWKYIGINLFTLTSGNLFWKILFDTLYFLTVTVVSVFLGYLIHNIPKISKITA